MNESELRNLLDDLQYADADSDAMSRLVVTRLDQRKIPHRCLLGKVEWQGKAVSPHFWVEVGDFIIDYCADRHLGDARAPQGVLRRAASAERYQGVEIVIDPWPEYIYKVVFKGVQLPPAAA